MIRNNIKKFAESLGYRQIDLINGTTLSSNTINRIWNNHVKDISFDTLDQLCTFLNCSIGDLIEYVNDNEMDLDDVHHLHEREEALKRMRSYRKKKQ